MMNNLTSLLPDLAIINITKLLKPEIYPNYIYKFGSRPTENAVSQL
jgi:hypothetical protein